MVCGRLMCRLMDERWERSQKALRARKNGLTFAAIGQLMGVSASYARDIVLEGERRKFARPTMLSESHIKDMAFDLWHRYPEQVSVKPFAL